MPARTVAICVRESAWIAATSWPPKAGFHAMRRSPSSSKPTASPVRPAPIAAAVRLATSRPHAVLGANIAHGSVACAQLIAPSATSSSGIDLTGVRRCTQPHGLVRAPAAELTERGLVHRERDHPTPEARGRTEQLAGDGGAIGLDEHTGGPARCGPGFQRGRRDDAQVRRVIERGVERAAPVQDLDGPAHLLVERRIGEEVTQPLELEHADASDSGRARGLPHGPPPRSAAVTILISAAGTSARSSGSTLHGSMSRSARGEHRRELQAQLDPAVVVLAAQVERPVVEREVPDAGGERQTEQLGQLRADLARVRVDGVPAREHEVERPLVANARGKRRARWRACPSRRRPDQSPAHPGCRPHARAPTRSPPARRPRRGVGRG